MRVFIVLAWPKIQLQSSVSAGCNGGVAAQVGPRRPPARSLRLGERGVPTLANDRAAAGVVMGTGRRGGGASVFHGRDDRAPLFRGSWVERFFDGMVSGNGSTPSVFHIWAMRNGSPAKGVRAAARSSA